MSNEEPQITQSISSFIKSHLGIGNFIDLDGIVEFKHYWSYRPVSLDVAKQILAVTNNEHTCYIQFADEHSPHLKEPLLWEWNAWTSQCDKWKRAAERSRIEREQRFIRDANVILIAKALVKLTGGNMDYEMALESADKMMMRDNWAIAAKGIGVSKLITKVEEI